MLPHVRFDCGFEYFNLLHYIYIAIVNHLTTDIQYFQILLKLRQFLTHCTNINVSFKAYRIDRMFGGRKL